MRYYDLKRKERGKKLSYILSFQPIITDMFN